MINRVVLLALMLLSLLPIILVGVSSKETAASSPERIECDAKGVQVLVRALHKHSDRWEVEFEIQNNAQSSLFFATEPMRSNGELGPYIGIGETDKTLEVSVRFFDGPNYFTLDLTEVKLKKLEPKTSHVEKYVLPLPLKETRPPFKELMTVRRPIDANKIETVKIYVGVVPDEEGIRHLLAPKKCKPFFDGSLSGGEIIETGRFKGKKLLETQCILSATYKVDDKNR